MRRNLGRVNIERDARSIRPLIYSAPPPSGALFGGVTPDTIEPDDIGAEGASSWAARADHVHGIVAAAPITDLQYNTINAEGSASSFARSDHTHAVVSSSNPSTTETILRSNSSGYLQLVRLGIGASPNFYLDVRGSTTPQALIGYDASNYAVVSVSSGGDVTLQSNPGDLILYPIGNDVRPNASYDVNLGMMTYKWKELHAAELWVNTLVAHETIATIGGRILVGATTEFTANLGTPTTHTDSVLNGGFETAGGGGADVFANWTESAGDGAISQVGSNPHSGTYNARLDTGATANTHVYQNISVSAGDYMSLSFWSRSFTGNTSVGRWWLYDVSNASDIRSLGVVANATAGDNTWVFTQYGFQVPAGCSQIRLYLYCGTVNTDDNHFDDVKLYDGITITVKHNEMAAGDVAYAESATFGTPQFEFFKILSSASGSPGSYTYEVERNYDSHSGSGSYNEWLAGDALFNTGTNDEGFMDIYSYNSVTKSGTTTGPTIAGFVRNSEYYNDWTERWAIGNLDGLYGEGATTYGVGLGDYANGNYMKYTSHDGNLLIKAGNDNVEISADGIGIEVGSVSNNAITWYNAGTHVGKIFGGGTGAIWITGGKDAGGSGYDGAVIIMGFGATGTSENYIWLHGGGTPYIEIDSNSYIEVNPQLRLTVSGSTGGYYAGSGSDVQWYRGGTDLWRTPDSVQIDGTLWLGSTQDTNLYRSSANVLRTTDSLIVDTGIFVGSGVTPTADDIGYDGNLYSRKGGANYDVFGFHPLTAYIGSATYAGGAFSTFNKTTGTKTVSTEFSGVPSTAKALLLNVSVRDSGSAANECWVIVSPNNSAGDGLTARCSGLANDKFHTQVMVVPTNGSNTIYFEGQASGASTLDISIRCYGYWL